MTERLTLRTADGWDLAADLHIPSGEPWGVALLGHAMMVDRRTMDRPKGAGLASTLAERGMVVVNVDFRGHGESARDEPTPFSFDDIVRYDIPALLAAARDRYPSLPRFLVGHSLGVNAGFPGAALVGDHGLSGAVALAPNLWSRRFESNLVRRVRKEVMLRGFDVMSRRTGFFDPAAMNMGKSKIPRAYIEQFWSFWTSSRISSADGSVDYEAALASLKLPILAISGARDAIMAHPDSVDRYLTLFRGADVRHVRWVGANGWTPDHMSIVIDPNAKGLFEASADFMRGLAGNAS